MLITAEVETLLIGVLNRNGNYLSMAYTNILRLSVFRNIDVVVFQLHVEQDLHWSNSEVGHIFY
jgi:hypothetical protein